MAVLETSRSPEKIMALARPQHRILVVEEDISFAAMIVEYLSKFEFDVFIHARGDDVARRILDESPDVVLLEVNAPGDNGYSVCKAIRQEYHGIVVMISAGGEDFDEVIGLELGADDYMSKPLRLRVLLARLRMHLRRANSIDTGITIEPIAVGALIVSPSSRTVSLDGEFLELTTAEFDLLWLLACHTGKTVNRDLLYLQLTGLEYDGHDRSIDLRVCRLRKKLGDDFSNPRIIKTIRGIGYLLAPPLNGK